MVRCLLPALALAFATSPVCQTPGSLPDLVSRAEAGTAQATEFRKERADRSEVAAAVGELTKAVKWHTRMRDARKLAQQDGKPIVWIQALGDLKGFT